MKPDRLTRVNELLRRELAGQVHRSISGTAYDPSAVTVSHVIASSNLRHARVLISIRDHEMQREGILARLHRDRAKIQHAVSRHVVLKYTPRLSFELDTSIEEGDRVLGLLAELEAEVPAPTEEAPADTTPLADNHQP